MASRYSSKDLRATAGAVERFIVAAEQLRQDRQNQDARAEVATAAGAARRGAEMADFYVAHSDPPAVGGRTFLYDPIMNWNSDISPVTDALSEAIEAGQQIHGILLAEAERAEQEERSVVGRVAGVVGFPSRVRKHLADRGYSGSVQRAGFFVSVLSQLAIATAAALLATLVIGWITS